MAWLGRALLVNATHGPCVRCAEGLLFSPPVVGCAGKPGDPPPCPGAARGVPGGVPPWEVRRSVPPMAAAPRDAGVCRPTLSDQSAPAPNRAHRSQALLSSVFRASPAGFPSEDPDAISSCSRSSLPPPCWVRPGETCACTETRPLPTSSLALGGALQTWTLLGLQWEASGTLSFLPLGNLFWS